MSVAWRLVTPSQGSGAIAVFELRGESAAAIDHAIAVVTGDARPIGVGEMPLRDLAGVDRGVVARWSEGCCHLMAHGGPAVIKELGEALINRGLASAEGATADWAVSEWPEAGTEVERRMLGVLARAASPMGVDLLLAQPGKWGTRSLDVEPAVRDRLLRRLIDPPLVAAVGRANVGKSSLLNALAGRQVAAVADEPGTTVDHVGVMIDFGGLVARFVDTPGVREGAPGHEREASERAGEVVAGADLVLVCGDALAGVPVYEPRRGQSVMVVATRGDLGRGDWLADHVVSVHDGGSIRDLVRGIREALVPGWAVESEEAWVFW